MLSKSTIIAFLATAKPDVAKTFYEGVLGLRLIADEPVALVFDANGVMLRVAKIQAYTPAPYTVLGWQVDDINRMVARLEAKGVTFQRYEGFDQDDMGIWTSPAGARVAWFKDPDGNTLSLTQFK